MKGLALGILVVLFLSGAFVTSSPSARAIASTSPPTIFGFTGGSAGAGTSFSVNLPSGASKGDLYIVCVGVNTNSVLTWPSNWILFLTQGSAILECRYKYADLTEGTVITVASVGSISTAHIAYLIHAFNNLSAPQVVSPPATGTSSGPDSPSLTVSPSENRLWISVATWTGGAATVNTYPSGYTQGQETFGNRVGVGSANVTAATENPGAFVLSGSATWYATTISIRPAEVAASVPSAIDYTPFWILLVPLLLFLALAYLEDSVIPLFPAGIVVALIAVEAWVLTSDVYTALSLVAVGVIILLIPLGRLIGRGEET